MFEKDLRRLSRRDLLELLLQQERTNNELKKRIDTLENSLASRTIEINNAGSMAEAALILNGVLESADKAAAQYLDNVKRLSEKQEKAYYESIRAAKQEAAEIIRAAEEERDKEMKKASTFSSNVYTRLGKLYLEHPEIKDWIAKSMQDNE